MAKREKKGSTWNDFFETTVEDFDAPDEPKEETEENVANEKAETSVTVHEPGTSSETQDNTEVEYFPLVDNETGQMYKLYEVMMKKLGIEIPELKDENLSDLEKESRRQKRDCIIVFEVERKGDIGKTARQTYEVACILCYFLVRQPVPIKSARSVSSSTPGTTMTKVRFYSLDDKKKVLAQKNITNKSRFRIDHDLTTTEIGVQSALVDFWKKRESQQNLPDKIFINNKWLTIQPVSQPSAQSN